MTEENKQLRCGMVSIVGRPNVGKSTLLNTILDEKVTIVSRVPQTTRNQVRGIYNDKRGQIVFIDTPGLHLGKDDRLDQFMNDTSVNTMLDVDCIIYLVDTTRHIGEEEEAVAKKLKHINIPIILGLNKVDAKGPYISEYISFWEKVRGMPVQEMKNFMMITLSGKENKNIPQLLDIIFDFLPEGPLLYPQDIVADVPQKMALSDIIREKLFEIMKEEIPHSIGVYVEQLEPMPKKMLHIAAIILVERETQRGIVIGKDGENLKHIGSKARREMEELLDQKIFLDLHVKVQPNWRNDPSILQDLGYDHL